MIIDLGNLYLSPPIRPRLGDAAGKITNMERIKLRPADSSLSPYDEYEFRMGMYTTRLWQTLSSKSNHNR